MTGNMAPNSPQDQLGHLFGSYKAEWLRERIYDLFTEPLYFPELTTPRPCMLLGGRGTGKTTVLKCLSYEGRFALAKHDVTVIKDWSFVGIYYRVNTNRVAAFKGPELDSDRWIRWFAHYFNIVLCDLTLRFLEWYFLHNPDDKQPSAQACSAVAETLNISNSLTVKDLANGVDKAKRQLEACVNNVADNQSIQLSMQGAPIDALLKAITDLPQFKNKHFFFLVDEYENLLDYQQQIVNTIIKHCGDYYSFKIGVKELGWRRRTTLNESEQLISPADYVRINITDKLEGARFEEFARLVCNERLRRLDVNSTMRFSDIRSMLPGLTEDEEANKLDSDGSGIARDAKREIELIASSSEKSLAEELTLLDALLVSEWARKEGDSLAVAWKHYVENPDTWKSRRDNHGHSLLYMLRRGKRGITKYYCGWNVFALLAGSNIRYLLELVDQSLLLHLQKGKSLSTPVSAKTQTLAAQGVGKKNLAELEGLSVHGAQLTKLLLGLGRVFQLMASDPTGHAPEINQFHLPSNSSSDSTSTENVDALLRAAVMHLALLRSPGNKLGEDADTKEYDYMVHPIYSAFFVFSHRRKRKMLISGEQLLKLISNPKRAIDELLSQNNRTSGDALPEQLLLFEGFYNAS